ncbi:MAG: SCP2 sterol-binding domain-containing protein [Anaerolineae bacterium]
MAEYKTKEELYSAMQSMVERMQANEALKARIGRGNNSVQFRVTDLGAVFTLRFADGTATAEPNDPQPATLAVSLTSRILDELFAGKRNPEAAYTYGALTLHGDEYTAEGMLRYFPAIIAAYKEATA